MLIRHAAETKCSFSKYRTASVSTSHGHTSELSENSSESYMKKRGLTASPQLPLQHRLLHIATPHSAKLDI